MSVRVPARSPAPEPAPSGSRPWATQPRLLPWALAALALVLSFLQRPGAEFTDTRIEMMLDPGLFLSRAADLWSSTVDLGHVQSGQFVGYLFPMGPWFAATEALGVPMWVAQRLWLALLLWAAGMGVLRLLQALYRPVPGVAHVAAAAVFMANPYVTVQANRATATLLAYIVVPWLLLAARRGLDDPRGWRWPAVAALAVACASAGTNAAPLVWAALAPAALLVYEVAVLRRAARDALAFAWRATLLTVLASLWWIVPLGLQVLHGSELLAFSEQPDAIWRTTSMAEAMRLMGYWISYFPIGFGESIPTSSAVGPFLTNVPVILATFAVPLLAIGGLTVTRRWPYAPFFGLLAVAGLLVMTAGYPITKRSAQVLFDLYYEVPPLQVLRTTYKAGPLVAIGFACLAGVAVQALLDRGGRWLERREVRLARWLPLALVPVFVLSAYPMFSGRLLERSSAYGEVPGAWRAAMQDADRAAGADRRILLLPGQQFSWFRWGQTFAPFAPVLTERPVLQRTVSRMAPARSAQLQDRVDDVLQQRRLVPGQLPPLLALLGVGPVVVATDGRPGQSGEAPAAVIAEALAAQGLTTPDAAYGRVRRYPRPAGEAGPRVALPDLRRYDGARDGPGIVRLRSREAPTILDGDSDGILALAAAGRLDPRRAVFYAGDLSRGRVEELLRQGGRLVFTDTNRRRVTNPSQIADSTGPTLAADEELPRDRASYELFADRGVAAQTVVEYAGLARLRAPTTARSPVDPAARAAVAFDGRLTTTWTPRNEFGATTSCNCLEIDLREPRRIDAIRVHPRAFDPKGTLPLTVEVDGGPPRLVSLSPLGWNRVPIRRVVRRLRLGVNSFVGPYGLDEVEIPGVSGREALRLPTQLAAMTRGLDLASTPIAIELERATADSPQLGDDRFDAEASIDRRVTLPVARRFGVEGWATPASAAPDTAIDALTGLTPGWRFASSGRYQGVPARRASSALDGTPATAWVAPYSRDRAPWLAWRAPGPTTFRTLRIVPGPAEFAVPATVDVRAGGRSFAALRVGDDGTVTLPRRVVSRDVRIDVVDVSAAAPREVRRGLQAVAVGEIVVPGLRPARSARGGAFTSPCGEAVVRGGGSSVPVRISGRIEALDRGEPVRVASCGGGALALPAGTSSVSAPRGRLVRIDRLSLVSDAAQRAPAAPGAVVSPGRGQDGRRDDVKLRLTRPGWLVLGESYAPAWRAWCTSADGVERALGAPRPIDGFANGWPVDPGCRTARMAFTPQRAATASYAVSAAVGGLVVLPLVLLTAFGARRRRGRGGAPAVADPGPQAPPPDAVRRLGLVPAGAIALAAGVVGAAAFTSRMGAALLVGTFVLLLAGVSVRRLLVVATVALLAVPLLYVSSPTETFTALSANRPTTNLPAHWLAVTAACALGAACAVDAWRRRRGAQR